MKQITNKHVIRLALENYPSPECSEVFLASMDKGKDIQEIATENEYGDTLMGFIALELDEGLNPKGSVAEMKSETLRLLDRAINDMTAVRNAIEEKL